MIEIRELKATDFSIDTNDLESEWQRVPQEIFFWGSKIAELKKKKLKAENKLEVMTAELEGKVRTDPLEYGIQKITEASVKAKITTQPEIKDAKDEVIDLMTDLHIACNALDAIHAIKSALPDLIKLRLNTMYANPVEPEGFDGKAFRKQQKEGAVESKINKEPSSRRKGE